MLHVGVDFHKNYSFITEMDTDGVVKSQQKIDNDRTILKGYLSKLPSDTKIVLEATCNWYYFYELAEEYDFDISLAQSL
jgi:hypothetical protein